MHTIRNPDIFNNYKMFQYHINKNNKIFELYLVKYDI